VAEATRRPADDILNAWIDARDWMPRVHAPEDVRAFYRDFRLPNREVWVRVIPIDWPRDGCRGHDGHGALRGAAGAGDGKCSSRRLGRGAALDVSGAGRAAAMPAKGFAEVRMTEGDNGKPARRRWNGCAMAEATVNGRALGRAGIGVARWAVPFCRS
jgi:hypothetical protein